MDLYTMHISAPCRAVEMVANLCGCDVNMKTVDLQKGEQMTPEFLAINPQHCVPTLVDGDVKLWESRAIIRYLVSKYGKDVAYLYPADDVAKRAKIDQLLDYDIGTLYSRFGKWFYPICFRGGNPKSDEAAASLKSLHETLKLMNDSFIPKNSDFMTGDKVTLADISIRASISMLEAAEVDFSDYDNINAWRARVAEAIPKYGSFNDEPVASFNSWYKAALKKLEA